jgi:zinc protease
VMFSALRSILTRQSHLVRSSQTMVIAGVLCVYGSSSSSVFAQVESNSASGILDSGYQLDQIVEDQDGTTRISLANGLEVVFVEVSPRQDVNGRETTDQDTAIHAWLIVRAGSLYEGDDQRGAAAIVEQMIRSGTDRFSDEEINRILANGDGSYGSQSGSFVSFDQAVYMAQFDRSDQDSFERALMFYSDVLDGDDFSREQFEGSKRDLIKLINTEESAELRSRQRWLPELMHSTRFGQRLPIPSLNDVEELSYKKVQRFREGHYHPGQATLMIMGDIDSSTIKATLNSSLASIHRSEERSRVVDARNKIDVSGRAVLDFEPGFETHQGAVVRFRDRDAEPVRSWSGKAGLYRHSDLRSLVIDRVAADLIRHRLDRLSASALDREVDIGVEHIDLFGQIELVQLGIESVEGTWEELLQLLIRECDRLYRDGAGTREIERARLSVLARWHRSAQDWDRLAGSRKIGMMHWMLTTGKPLFGMDRWDEMATEYMDGIGDEEINDRVRSMSDMSEYSFIALAPSESRTTHIQGAKGQSAKGEDPIRRNRRVIDVVEEAMESQLEPVDPDWMEKLVGPLVDMRQADGEIREISHHGESGVWTTVLMNGVRQWTRSMRDGSGRVRLSATVHGGILSNPQIDELLVRGAMQAWEMPATESRTHRAIRAYLEEYDIQVYSAREVGYIQLRIDADSRSVDQALELMQALLARPMIEQNVHEDWVLDANRDGADALDEALGFLYQGIKPKRDRSQIQVEDTQRMLTEVIRTGQIDIGIAGDIDIDHVIERSALLFGSLSDRDESYKNTKSLLTAPAVQRERVVRLDPVDKKDQGEVIGFIDNGEQSLESLRSLILGSMVLGDAIQSRADEIGYEGIIRVQVGYSDAIGDQTVFMIRIYGDESDVKRANQIIDEAVLSITSDGVSELALRDVQERIDNSIGRYYPTSGYWSQRMSTLRVRGRRVDELWGIRDGYRDISIDDVSNALISIASSNERFRVKLTSSTDSPDR